MADDISMEKAYDPKGVEDDIYTHWMGQNAFAPENSPLVTKDSEHFSIVLPPPNVTGTLHMGHAAMLAIEDAMVRYARMSGKKTLWIPGTDHAAIATESKVEKILIEEEGKTRHDLGRERFLDKVKDFAQDSHDTIVNQMKKMGASVDWGREAYTLDDARHTAVKTAFQQMFEDGLIYRGYRVVNWDPRGATSVSDDEVQHKEVQAKLYTFKYSEDFPIAISTTRPETKVGDTAVAVHPEDERYKQFIGQTFEVNFAGVKLSIKVIADAEVDPEFGTGALGVTPAHSSIDFAMAERHDLEMIQVIGENGRMTKGAGELVAGKTTLEAREIIADWLHQEGLLEQVEETVQNLSVAERSGGTIEPLPKEQWFINVNKEFPFRAPENHAIEGIKDGEMVTLKSLMQHVVRSKQIEILPDRFEKTYFRWIDNLRDWNISRQIWFGHQIPVWYCLACEAPQVNAETESKWFIVRHGETDWNKEHRLQGQEDIPLNEAGREQAMRAAEQLKGQNIDLIVSSDLARARETAEIIAKEIGSEVEFDERLRERSFGKLEGLTYHETLEKYQGDIRTEEKVEDVELYSELEERVAKAFEDHRMNHVGKNVVLVSHGGAIRMLRKHISNLTHEGMLSLPRVKNAEVIQFDRVKTPCKGCGNDLFIQDQDTLDTWFSSGLWTFSTLGWPEKLEDFNTFHPTSVLETGYDILFFWVARMILMSSYLVGQVPFKTVYLHGLVRDGEGRKMSKSLGNIINPLDMISEYGADATRLSLLIGATPGNDMALSEEKIAGFRNFTNKLWNIARFVFMSVDDIKQVTEKPAPKTLADRWILGEYEKLAQSVTGHFDKYEYSMLGEELRDFTWNTFASWYIEIAKIQKKREGEDGATDQILLYILEGIIKMWHPFMPFVTEEIYKQFNAGDLIVAPWPKEEGGESVEEMNLLQQIVVAIRNIRAEKNISYKKEVKVYIAGIDEESENIDDMVAIIENLTNATVFLKEEPEGPTAAEVVGEMKVSVLMESGIVDMSEEREKIKKAIQEAEGQVKSIEGRLANKSYVENAPEAVVNESRVQLEEVKAQLDALNKELERLTV